ncbi:MAG: type III pantothenate kinase [Gemmatimonadota bacterium]
MKLGIDVGNTETVIGILEDLEVRRFWRIATEPRRTGDEIALFLRGLLGADPMLRDRLERSVIASVVPGLDRAWDEALAGLGLPSFRVHAGTPLPIRLEVEEPASVGADRIVNTLAVARLVGRNTVVVDLGTATTFDCITADGAFVGGVIAPGPRAGLERLVEVAAQLPAIEIRRPERVVGRRTVACLDSGVFYSIVDGIDGIVRRILAEWSPDDPLVVATGGLAELVAPHCETVERVEPHLTLLGLACADACRNETPKGEEPTEVE